MDIREFMKNYHFLMIGTLRFKLIPNNRNDILLR